MRKLVFVLTMAVLTLALGSCGTENTAGDNVVTDHQDIDDLVENIGKNKDEVFKDLDVEEGDNIEVFEEKVGQYVLSEERTFHDAAFQYILNFDHEPDKLYGFWYLKNFEGLDDENEVASYELTLKLKEDFNAAYGEPTTFEGKNTKLSDMPDIEDEDFWPDEAHYSYSDMWLTEDDLEVQLIFGRFENFGYQVKIFYQLSEWPDDWDD